MEYKIKSRIWVELDDNMVLGEGRVSLLKSIEKTKSLSKSAKDLKISYKKAWGLVDSVNKNAKEPVVIKSSGGSGGGGTFITEYGKSLLDTFDTVNKNCWTYLDKQAKKFEDL